MLDPARALETQVREELNIHPAELAPLKDGLVTGTATAVGAFIPIVPFLVMPHGPAVWVSLAISMAAHFGIGAARSLFTGRGIWVSGRDMFVVGFGVAAVGYLIGELLPRLCSCSCSWPFVARRCTDVTVTANYELLTLLRGASARTRRSARPDPS